MTRAVAFVALGLAWTFAAGSVLSSGDLTHADAMWAIAEAEAGGALDAPVYLDALKGQSHIRPWQLGFSGGRARMVTVIDARRQRQQASR